MIRRCFAGVAALATVLALAAPAAAQSLEEAMVLAYTNNPTLLAARAELRAVDEQIAQALGGYRPTISANGDYGIERSDSSVTNWQTLRPATAGIELNQPVYRGGGTEAAVSQADNVIEAQRANLLATEQQVLLDTVTTYMNVVLTRRLVDLAVNNEERLARQLQATEDRFRVGEVTRTDVSQAKASYANAQAARISAEGDLITAQAAFEEVIGVVPTTLSAPGPLVGLPNDIGVAAEVAQAENPTILAALASEAAAQDSVDVRFASLLPTISLRASYRQAYDPSINISRQDDAQLLATLTIPIYQAGQAESLVREAKQTASQRRIEVDEARRAIQSSLVQSWQALATAQAQIVAFQEEVTANQVALDGTQREADVGERTVLDVLDAEQTLFQSQINLAVAERDTVVASYALKNTLGQLTAQELALPVEYYDVTLHYRDVRDDWGFGGLFEGAE